MSDEIHIAGVIVSVSRAEADNVRAQLAHVPKAVVHAAAEDGRLVVTLETGSTKATLDYMDAIRALPGVYNVALVYQHAEPVHAMDEVIS
jgi:nitrate reductase NapD